MAALPRVTGSHRETLPGRYRPPITVGSAPLRDILAATGRNGFEDRQLDFLRAEFDQARDLRIWFAGDLELLSHKCVSIVGKREASPEGRARARRLARELTDAGVVVVSGLARGIDTEAHLSALNNNGRTVAVIGTPLSKASPSENASLQQAIWQNYLLISPFPQGSTVHRSNFPQRNKFMAALSDATVIVEADDNSGTLHQAVACQKLGRWLFIAKSVVETRAWPTRFLNVKNTVVLERTEQILGVLDRQ
jgi:DNA processing protein